MKQKNALIAVVAAVAIVGLVGYLVAGKKSSKPQQKQMQQDVEAIPTVDASVKVNLTSAAGNNVVLTVEDLPSDTETIDYTLSYETSAQGSQGIIGEGIEVESDEKFTVTRFLGTQSSGSSVYHEVVGPIKLELKFTGDYGQKIFEKEYSI